MLTRHMLLTIAVVGLPGACLFAGPPARSVSTKNVTVVYEQVDRAFARAAADICQTARDTFAARFGCDMPSRLTVRMLTGWAGEPVLFGNGRDEIVLRLEIAGQLARYGDDGVHFVYGLCRETARIALARSVGDATWLSSTAREGWGHYAASVALDAVVAARGVRVWPQGAERYLDGMSRLRNQLEQRDPPPMIRVAGDWHALAERVRPERLGQVFRAWSAVATDAPDPGGALAKGLADSGLATWFASVREHFVDATVGDSRSALVETDVLIDAPVILHYDDGKSEGRERLGGQGHAMRFEAPGGEWYLRVVRIYARREGRVSLLRDDIRVWLCDAELKMLAEFRQRGNRLRRGAARWHRVGTPPVRVPQAFVICVQFGEGSLGDVAVHYDADSKGHALIALPGQEPRLFERGDWMIRVGLSRRKAHDPLRPDVTSPTLAERLDGKTTSEFQETEQPRTATDVDRFSTSPKR